MLFERLPEVVVAGRVVPLEPSVTHAWLVVVERQRVLVIQLMVRVVTVEVDVHWVFSKLSAPHCSAIL